MCHKGFCLTHFLFCGICIDRSAARHRLAGLNILDQLRFTGNVIRNLCISKPYTIRLMGIASSDAEGIIFAYEPIWAIGTGKTATNEQAEEVCFGIRSLLTELYGSDTSEMMRIQYGGSVNRKNAAGLFAMCNIDGGLVGGASLTEEFAEIVKAAGEA